MGKDNVPFHTLSFPATLLGSGEPWKLVDRLKSFNWLTYYGGKFSTSDHRGVFMSDALELLPADYWRWYLMANAPESDDSSFTWELFGTAVNKELVGTFGNLVNRTITQVERHFESCVPSGGEGEAEEAEVAVAVQQRLEEYVGFLDALEFRKAAASLRALWSVGNVYLETREPWKTIKVDSARTACTLRTALELLVLCAVASEPFIPGAAAQLQSAFPTVNWESFRLTADLPSQIHLAPGDAVISPGLLFAKLSAEQLAEWEERFGGTPVEQLSSQQSEAE
jgi:methionyl-tRNA synthetase